MYLDYYGRDTLGSALEKRITRAGGVSLSIWWNRVDMILLTYEEMNKVIDELEKSGIEHIEPKEKSKTVATLNTLGVGWFVRYTKEVNMVEVCGSKLDDEGDIRLFRFGITKADGECDALSAWISFQKLVVEETGRSINKIFGGLPLEYHQYRFCVPSPINWASAVYTVNRGRIAEKCVKADICSAYGTEGSKTLPECRISKGKVIKGRVEPTEALPFAFYLKSGHMAVWGEGDTMTLNEEPWITNIHTIEVEADDDETLLLPVADCNLRPVYEKLYNGRAEHPENKDIINLPIGMYHRKKNRTVEDNLWPISAVIKFRCNKRIVDTCHWLVERGQKPILINTDSILWVGEWKEEFGVMFSKEKALGNFTLEYEQCRAVIRGPKVYQIESNGEVITRWSGAHSRKYTNTLDFGMIWSEKVNNYLQEIENKNTIRWSKKRMRYMNANGEVFTNSVEQVEEHLLWLKQN